MMVSTALLTVGWWFLSLAARGRSLEISHHQSVRLGGVRILGEIGSNFNSIHHTSNLSTRVSTAFTWHKLRKSSHYLEMSG